MWKYKVVAIDYDGTLVENVHPATTGKKMANADIVTQKLREMGWEIIIFTCRPNFYRKQMEKGLKEQGIVYDYISFFGKPIASLYIDDKGFRFEGDWLSTLDWIMEKEKLEEVMEDR
jgi:hydroxymethylpyrimidine pyrophosphatase-like HAD family hydrolase